MAVPKPAGLCSARPQAGAEQRGEGSVWPRSRPGVKRGFFSLTKGLGAKFGAGLGCGAGANWEHWAWRSQGGEFGLLGQFGDSSHLPPRVGQRRRAWKRVLARGWGLAVSCKMMLMLQTVRVSRFLLHRLCLALENDAKGANIKPVVLTLTLCFPGEGSAPADPLRWWFVRLTADRHEWRREVGAERGRGLRCTHSLFSVSICKP